jgi:hypothetical protein
MKQEPPQTPPSGVGIPPFRAGGCQIGVGPHMKAASRTVAGECGDQHPGGTHGTSVSVW